MDMISKYEVVMLKVVSFMVIVVKQVFLVIDFVVVEMFEIVYVEMFGFNSCLWLYIFVFGVF